MDLVIPNKIDFSIERIDPRKVAPDVSMLNDEQIQIYNDADKFISGELPDYYFLLNGPAGTGKSFLTGKIIHNILHRTNLKVCVTAFTHKAVGIMRYMSPFDSPNLTFKTLASLHKVRVQEKNGEKVYVPNPYEKGEGIEDFDIIINDEASMTSREFEKLNAKYYPSKYFFYVGDIEQLLPVGERTFAKHLRSKTQKKFLVTPRTLTQIVRQNDDSPIIKLSRQVLTSNYKGLSITDLHEDEGNYAIKLKPNGDEIVNILSRAYEKLGSQFKVLSFTNKRSKFFSEKIRKKIYTDPKIVELDENITLRDPWVVNNFIMFSNSEELRITGIELKKKYVVGEIFEYYELQVESVDIAGRVIRGGEVHMVHEDQQVKLLELADKLNKDAIKAKRDGKYGDAKKCWRNRFILLGSFIDWEYSYSCTIHRSQGSTYAMTALDVQSLGRVDSDTKRRLAYVGVTRSKSLNLLMS